MFGSICTDKGILEISESDFDLILAALERDMRGSVERFYLELKKLR